VLGGTVGVTIGQAVYSSVSTNVEDEKLGFDFGAATFDEIEVDTEFTNGFRCSNTIAASTEDQVPGGMHS
jgi:hypothetical protein